MRPAWADRHRHRARRPDRHRTLPGAVTVGARIVAGLVAAVVLAAAGFGWSLNTHGRSNAVVAAGNVGVVHPTASSPTADAPGFAAGSGASAVADPSGNVAPASQQAPSTQPAAPDVPAVGAENILLVGADSRTDARGNPLTQAQQRMIGVPLDGGGVNTDTLLIMHIPAGGGRATGVSIPRDTWMGPSIVDAPGVTGPDQYGNQVHYRPGKINGFYSTAKYYQEQYLAAQGVTGAALQRRSDEAGRTMLIKIIQQFTGIKINHYAEVNLLGFYLLSKAIGGVPVCLKHATHDPLSGADFPAGRQTVEGKTALAFVRQRHGVPGSDLGRIKRQQAFLSSALNKILSVGTLTSPSRLAALIDAAHRSLVLDSGFDLLTFAEQMRDLVAGNVHFVTLPTTAATAITSTEALAADPAQVRTIFAALTAGRPLPRAVTSSSPRTRNDHSSTSHGHSGAGTARTGTGLTTPPTPPPSGYQVPCVN